LQNWSPGSCRLRLRDLRRGVLRELLLERRDILEQAGRGQAQEVEAERRILDVKLLDLIVGHRQHHAGFDAFQRLGSRVRRRQHAELADDGANRQLDAGLDQAEAAPGDIEHAVGLLVLVEQDFAGSAFARRREWPQPVHRQIAVDRPLHIADQLQHLVQAGGVHRQQHGMQDQGRVIVGRDRGRDQDD
ncbi:hypothetical protein SA6_12165, partial [Staphylococcus epidermidis]